MKEHVENAVATLADMLQNSELREEAIESERGVITRELEEVENSIEEVVTDKLHETAYQGTPMAYTILGPVKNIRSITRQQIREYVSSHFIAPRMILVGTGKVSHDKLVKLAEKHFSNLPTAPSFGSHPKVLPARYTGSDIRIHNESFPYTRLAIGFEGPEYSSADTYPMMLISNLLGAWDKGSGSAKNVSSTMCQKVAESDLARSIGTFNFSYSDTSLFGVSAVAQPEHLEDLSFVIMNELVKLCFKVNDADVARSRNALKSQLLSQYDGSSSALNDEIGKNLIYYGRRLTPAEIFSRVDAIDADAVKRVAMKYFYDRDPVMAAYGDISHIPDYSWLRSWTYWLR